MNKKDLEFDLDLKILEDGHKEYISQTRKKYFYLALRKKYRDEVIKILKEKGINNIL